MPRGNKTTNILYICHDGDLYGSQQSLLLLLKHLPASYQPFISLARKGALTERLEDLPHVTLLSHQRLQWVKHDKRSFIQKIGDLLGLLISFFRRTSQVYRHIKTHQIDLVHTNSTVSLEGALAAKLAGIPHIWHIRELFMEENPKFHLVLGRKLSRWIIHTLSDTVCCISEAVREQFKPYLKTGKYHLLYNAVQWTESPKQLVKKDMSFTIGYIGRLSAGKRFQDLVESIAAIKAQNAAPLKVLVAGTFVDAPFEKLIKQRIQTLQLEDTIQFLGYQPNLTPLYETLHVLVLPSLHEPFGRVIIEAMAMGVPCVAANSGGIPELITDGVTGFLFPPTHIEALTGVFQKILANQACLASIQENARRWAHDRFTIEKQWATLEPIYQSLCAPRASIHDPSFTHSHPC